MFCPSGTHQCNPKFPKIPLKLNESIPIPMHPFQRVNSNAFLRNSEDEKIFYQNFTYEGINYISNGNLHCDIYKNCFHAERNYMIKCTHYVIYEKVL